MHSELSCDDHGLRSTTSVSGVHAKMSLIEVSELSFLFGDAKQSVSQGE